MKIKGHLTRVKRLEAAAASSSTSITRIVNYRTHQKILTGRNHQLQLDHGKMYIASLTRNRLLQPSQGEAKITHELLFFSNGLKFKTTPSSPSFFLYKITFLSFDCWVCLWFCYSLHVPNCNSLLLPNKLIFAGEIAHSFIFKVNISN